MTGEDVLTVINNPGFLIPLAGLIGLVVGSFLNVVIWRVPRGESIIKPASRCPGCGHELRWWENLPVVSWLWLGRRCSSCKVRISARYPIVELLTGALFVLVAWHFGATIEAIAFAYLAAIAVALALIDLDVHRLPDSLVLPSYIVVGVLLIAATWVAGDGWWPLARAAVGGAAMFVIYFAAAVLYPGGMGLGDVKLSGVLGIALGWLGWGALAVGWFAAFILGGLFSVGLIVTRRAGKGSGIPFGPWMLLGALVGVAAGEPLWQAYVSIFT